MRYAFEAVLILNTPKAITVAPFPAGGVLLLEALS